MLLHPSDGCFDVTIVEFVQLVDLTARVWAVVGMAREGLLLKVDDVLAWRGFVAVTLKGKEREAMVAIESGEVGRTAGSGFLLTAVVVDHHRIRSGSVGPPDAAVELIGSGGEVDFFGRRRGPESRCDQRG